MKVHLIKGMTRQKHTIVQHSINKFIYMHDIHYRVIILISCFFKAEDIREMTRSLGGKHRELTTLETNRKHQKEGLRRREDDLRGLLGN